MSSIEYLLVVNNYNIGVILQLRTPESIQLRGTLRDQPNHLNAPSHLALWDGRPGEPDAIGLRSDCHFVMASCVSRTDGVEWSPGRSVVLR
jgi:hypothetical protein